MSKILKNNANDGTKEIKQSRGCLKSFLVALLIFAVVAGAVAKIVVDLVDDYNKSREEVERVIAYLNEPYNVNEIVTDAIVQENYDNFVTKALAASFTVFDNGAVNLNQDISLASDLSLTDKELGAFIGRALAANSINYSNNLITLIQLNLTENDAAYTLKTVFRLNFTSVQQDIAAIVENFPANIYITFETEVLVANNELTLISETSSLQFNQLEQEKNQSLINFINTVFNDNTTTVTFLDALKLIVKDVLSHVTTKSESTLSLQNGGILIAVSED